MCTRFFAAAQNDRKIAQNDRKGTHNNKQNVQNDRDSFRITEAIDSLK